MNKRTPAQQISQWADLLRDISASGLRYEQNIYHRENYTVVQAVVREMLAYAQGMTETEIEQLREPYLDRFTPYVGGDGAVIDDEDRILLIQRADNGKWAMPGGAMNVGQTITENVAREVLEETNVLCEPHTLVGVYDSRYTQAGYALHVYLFTFLCKPLKISAPGEASHSNEVKQVRWFRRDELPPDPEMTPDHAIRIREVFRVWEGDQRPGFD